MSMLLSHLILETIWNLWSKQRVKQGVWTWQSSGTVFSKGSPLRFGNTTDPSSLCSSDENMTYCMAFCRDQYRSASLENILLLFSGETIVRLIGNTVSGF